MSYTLALGRPEGLLELTVEMVRFKPEVDEAA